MSSNKRPAFTLIELLVVISVISLLIAVLLPALSSARQAAHMSRSLSNIRQITTSIHMYANDHKGVLPPRSATRYNSLGNPSPDWPYWPYKITQMGYNTSPNVFWSPARNTSEINMTAVRSMGTGASGQEGWSKVGYAANENVMNFNVRPLQLGASGNPPESDTILLCEAWNAGSDYKAGFYFMTPNWVGRPLVGVPFTYKRAAVRSYVDGHAKAAPTEEMGWEAIDAYNGQWTYPTYTDLRGRKPWYRDWQNGIYD